MKYIYIIAFFIISFNAKGQQLIVESGISSTSFEFKNSQGESLDNLHPTSQNYISLGYRHPIASDILFGIVGVGINNYGAKGSDNTVNNYFEWETNYLGVFAGVAIKVLKTKKLAFYLKGTTSAEFILQGTQTLNNQVFDLVGEEDFDSTTFFFRGGTLVEYSITNILSLFVQYRYGKSTVNGTTEKLNYKTHDVGFGLVIKLNQ